MRARTAALATTAILAMISCADEPSPAGPTAIDAPAAAAPIPASAVSLTSAGNRPAAPTSPAGAGDAPVPPAPTVRKLIELPAVEVGGTIQLRSTCDTPATWETSDAAVATVDDGLVTGVAAGRARISETCGGVTSSVSIEVVAAPDVSYAFDPTPPARIDEGDTGHFRVNVTRGGRRSRVTEGVTSSAPDVLRLELEGDRWRYTGIAAGSAEIHVTQGGSRRLTHAVEVAAPTVSYAFDPTPPARITEGDTGHFRVNVTRDGRRSRVTEGVTSSAPGVLRLNLEGDRWRYTGTGPGNAEIRVTQGGSRRLTYSVRVMDRPEPWRRSGTGATIIDLPTRITRIRIEGQYNGRGENFVVWCGAAEDRGGLLVNEIIGTRYSTTYSGVHSARRSYGGRGQPCRELQVEHSSGVRWTITETSPRSGFTSPSTGSVRGDEAAVRRAREQVDRAMNTTGTR